MTTAEQNNDTKKNILCSTCDAELDSDTEYDEDKNIGCDFCHRWYHLKCTRFLGIPYEEAATLDYQCDFCH